MTRPAGVDLAALSAVAFAGLLVGLSLRPGAGPTPSRSPGSSQVTVDTSTRPTPGRSAAPTPVPTPWPIPVDPCDLPEQLPAPPLPVAAPRVEARSVAVVFSSYLYERSPGGRLFAQDSDPRYGLWFAAPGAIEARLLVAATERGAVLPLGLSPRGETVAVWYLPESREWGAPACLGGIYLMSTADRTSRLVMERDWRAILDDDYPTSVDDRLGPFWPAGQTQDFDTVVHRLPEVAISANGRSVALVEHDLITVIGPGRDGLVRQHAGRCTSWAWSPRGARFVAGCEHMTSAWTIDVGLGYDEDFHPLPLPGGEDLSKGWERWWAATIGYTVGGDIRVVRFFGFATGCEGPVDSGCYIPPPFWTETRIEPYATGQRSRVAEADFLTDVHEIGRDARLSADASWVYIRTYGSYTGARTTRARAIDIESGEIVEVRRLGEPVGTSLDGRLLFESRLDEERDLVVVRSLDRSGTAREVATIAWPEGAGTDDPIIDTFGLAVALRE